MYIYLYTGMEKVFNFNFCLSIWKYNFCLMFLTYKIPTVWYLYVLIRKRDLLYCSSPIYTPCECYCNSIFLIYESVFITYTKWINHAYLPFYCFHLVVVVGTNGGIACISRVPNRRGLPLGCDIPVCGLPYATRKRTGAVDYG